MTDFEKARDEAAESHSAEQMREARSCCPPCGSRAEDVFFDEFADGPRTFKAGADWSREYFKKELETVRDALDLIVRQNSDMSAGDIRDSWHDIAINAIADRR